MRPPDAGSPWWAVALFAVMVAVFTAAWRIGIRRARRRETVCDRDVQHDRVTLSDDQQAAWLEFRARFELEAEAEEQARMKPGNGSETAP